MITKIKEATCYYCGHTGDDVTSWDHIHIGGRGDVSFPVCNDVFECTARIEKAKEEKEK